jgi:pyruvate-formate lyase-activating enzyme
MLDSIGFYTLTDKRAWRVAASTSPPLSRCEVLLSNRCNFRCPYCRRVGGPDADPIEVKRLLDYWIADGLAAVRFSGGEPTLWPDLKETVMYAAKSIPRVAISTNGSATTEEYNALLNAGANDFSVSLDACCAADGEEMNGGISGAWERVVENIRFLSRHTYVTVGVVLTESNQARLNDVVRFASRLGVDDIRIIPAAQAGARLSVRELPATGHPILQWRWERLQNGLPVRGINAGDSPRCSLVLDDMAVMDGQHYPCIIYLREGGTPIGPVGPTMREDRRLWCESHRSDADPICSRQCLDFCVAHNNRVRDFATPAALR